VSLMSRAFDACNQSSIQEALFGAYRSNYGRWWTIFWQKVADDLASFNCPNKLKQVLYLIFT
ncbi:hypothetical protein NIE88_20960, partial [Sporolactobacillus shoreicorticis]